MLNIMQLKDILEEYPITKEHAKDFYESKYREFEVASFGTAILTVIANYMYFITDCQIYGRFAYETFIPRFSITFALVILMIAKKCVKSTKVMSYLLYIIPHAAMWSTVWAIYYLPNREFAREGFIIMQFSFLAIGLAPAIKIHLLMHSLYILDIILSNMIIHYRTFDMMITLSLPVYLGSCAVLFIVDLIYRKLYYTEKKIKDISNKDALTEVYNRKILKHIVTNDGKKLNWEEETYCLMLDIDHFKSVNDTFGHENGDKILRYFVGCVKGNIRNSDYLIRFGGEEFVLLLVNLEKSVALKVAERIRNSVETRGNDVCPITVSIGVSKVKEDVYKAIREADEALYYVKENGRNSVKEYSAL